MKAPIVLFVSVLSSCFFVACQKNTVFNGGSYLISNDTVGVEPIFDTIEISTSGDSVWINDPNFRGVYYDNKVTFNDQIIKTEIGRHWVRATILFDSKKFQNGDFLIHIIDSATQSVSHHGNFRLSLVD